MLLSTVYDIEQYERGVSHTIIFLDFSVSRLSTSCSVKTPSLDSSKMGKHSLKGDICDEMST